jgi:hypothetical protein
MTLLCLLYQKQYEMAKQKQILSEGLRVERIDDIPLLISLIQKIEVGKILDQEIKVHNNWEGLSLGKLAEIWLSYILSEGDHRLNQLEGWAMERIMTLRSLYEGEQLSRTNFTDDKLGLLLDYLDKSDYWSKVEQEVNKKIIRVYKILQPKNRLPVIRLDATVGQSHKKPEENGLFQFGRSKQFNPALSQFNLMVSTMDSEINGFAYPIASLVNPGNTADDILYLPILEQTKKSLSSKEGLLIVGDKKLGSQSNREQIVKGGDYYLCPLSRKQIPLTKLSQLIGENEVNKVVKDGKEIGIGFEYNVNIKKREQDGEWKERRIAIKSNSYARSQIVAFEKRLERAKAQLENLLVRKQRRTIPKTEEELKLKVSSILKKEKIHDCLKIIINKKVTEKSVRAYRGKKATTKQVKHLELSVELNEEKIEEFKKTCGWNVYGTNLSEQKMNMTSVVMMYRDQYQIESRFNDLKNKVTKLLPLYLQKESRIKSLINFMMLGLKVVAAIEIKSAEQLKKKQKELTGIYAGNPKRGNNKPSAKMMLARLKGISISVLIQDGKLLHKALTPLDDTQKKILKLLGVKNALYEELISKINLSF